MTSWYFITVSSITIQCTDIQVRFQQSNSTEAREDKDPRIFLRIQVIIEPSTAILGKEVTLNFSVVAGNATGKLDTVYMCYKFNIYFSVNEWLLSCDYRKRSPLRNQLYPPRRITIFSIMPHLFKL